MRRGVRVGLVVLRRRGVRLERCNRATPVKARAARDHRVALLDTAEASASERLDLDSLAKIEFGTGADQFRQPFLMPGVLQDQGLVVDAFPIPDIALAEARVCRRREI